jgi:hypothetical protein
MVSFTQPDFARDGTPEKVRITWTATNALDVIRTHSLPVDETWRGNRYHVDVFATAFLPTLNADFVDTLGRAPGRKITQTGQH